MVQEKPSSVSRCTLTLRLEQLRQTLPLERPRQTLPPVRKPVLLYLKRSRIPLDSPGLPQAWPRARARNQARCNKPVGLAAPPRLMERHQATVLQDKPLLVVRQDNHRLMVLQDQPHRMVNPDNLLAMATEVLHKACPTEVRLKAKDSPRHHRNKIVRRAEVLGQFWRSQRSLAFSSSAVEPLHFSR